MQKGVLTYYKSQGGTRPELVNLEAQWCQQGLSTLLSVHIWAIYGLNCVSQPPLPPKIYVEVLILSTSECDLI